MGYIRILEFGSQTTDRIGKRLEDMGVSVQYGPSNMDINQLLDADGVILSGGPKGAKDPDAYPFSPMIFAFPGPILGICYGHQLIGRFYGSDLHRNTREYGETRLTFTSSDPLLSGLSPTEIVWMNHGDSITEGDFSILGYTEKGVPGVIRHEDFYGVQFHPEVTHTENGKLLLRNFASMCGFEPRDVKFDIDKFVTEAVQQLRDDVGDNTLLAYLSGGVDSTAAVMLAKEAGLRIVPVYIETGFGRKGESQFAYERILQLLGQDLYIHDRTGLFLSGVSAFDDSEAKRKRFQTMYNETRAEIERQFDLHDTVLFDGSLVTDFRESGQEAGTTYTGNTVDAIKTHHNSGGWKGRKAAPLSGLTKEQTRMVARHIGLPKDISERPPFPGPGLSVRMPTAYYEVPKELQCQAQDLARKNKMEAFVLSRKSVGLKGDSRALEHAVIITGERNWANIRRTGKSLIEDLPVCRVLYSPSGVSFSNSDLNQAMRYPLTMESLDRLREVTEVMEITTAEFGVRYSQMPVIAFGGPNGWINVGRDVDSEDFRTCRPLRRPDEFSWECSDEIDRRLKERLGNEAGVTTYDVSDKPGGTTEWE